MAASRRVPPAFREEDHALIADLAGVSDLEQPAPSFDRLIESRPAGSTVDAIAFDTTELGAWDSSLQARSAGAVVGQRAPGVGGLREVGRTGPHRRPSGTTCSV